MSEQSEDILTKALGGLFGFMFMGFMGWLAFSVQEINGDLKVAKRDISEISDDLKTTTQMKEKVEKLVYIQKMVGRWED